MLEALYSGNDEKENLHNFLLELSYRLNFKVNEGMISDVDMSIINEIQKMKVEIETIKVNINKTKKKISFYIFIFFICFITFIEIIFYVNIISLLLSLVIGSLSFILSQKEKNRLKRSNKNIEELKNSIEIKISELSVGINERRVNYLS